MLASIGGTREFAPQRPQVTPSLVGSHSPLAHRHGELHPLTDLVEFKGGFTFLQLSRSLFLDLDLRLGFRLGLNFGLEFLRRHAERLVNADFLSDDLEADR